MNAATHRIASMPPDTASLSGGSTASLRRLLTLRWVAIAGQLVGAIATERLLEIPLAIDKILLVAGAQALLNGISYLRLARATSISDLELLLQLLADVLGLSLIVYFSGGAMNPLITLFMPLIAVAAAILPARHAAAIAAASIFGYSLLYVVQPHIHIHDHERTFQLHLIGMWMTFVFSALLIAWFVVRMTAAVRSRDSELAAAREAALRNERVVALGNLAAGAAHELGTPLATIAVLSGELTRNADLPQEVREDLQLLASQVLECKRIITLLAARAGSSRAEGAQAVALDVWLTGLIERWRSQRPLIQPAVAFSGSQPGPRIVPDATLEQALLNLFNNAADASPGSVDLVARWDEQSLELDVLDRGKGIPANLVGRLGREAVTTRADGHGIGLVLAFAAIERSGGTLSFSARNGGGTLARIQLGLTTLKSA